MPPENGRHADSWTIGDLNEMSANAMANNNAWEVVFNDAELFDGNIVKDVLASPIVAGFDHPKVVNQNVGPGPARPRPA